GVFERVTLAIRHKIGDAHIQAYSPVVLRQQLWLDRTNALEIPAGRTLHNAGKAELTLEWAMDIYSNLAATLLWSLEVAALQYVRPITKLNRVPALCGLEARETDTLAFFPALEKGGKRSVQSLHNLVSDDGGHMWVSDLVVSLILFVDMQVLSRRLEVR